MQTVSMTTKEIADVTGKRHDNVIQDVKRMCAQLYPNQEWDSLKFRNEQIQGVTVVSDGRGFISHITLDKHHAFTLVSGYYARMRMAAIRYIDKLEERLRVDPQIRAMPAPQQDTSLLLDVVRVMSEGAQVELAIRLYEQERAARSISQAINIAQEPIAITAEPQRSRRRRRAH